MYIYDFVLVKVLIIIVVDQVYHIQSRPQSLIPSLGFEIGACHLSLTYKEFSSYQENRVTGDHIEWQ